MAARLRARAAPGGRAADGLDLVGRHEAAAHLHFDTKEDAIAYCEQRGIAYQVIEPKDSKQRQVAYADNFAFKRVEPWTH